MLLTTGTPVMATGGSGVPCINNCIYVYDDGTEFKNSVFQKLLKDNGVKFFTTKSEKKASIVERFNRTLKTKMWKYFTSKNTIHYLDVLPELASSYDSAYHRSIKMYKNGSKSS